jgi:hypothetical protein
MRNKSDIVLKIIVGLFWIIFCIVYSTFPIQSTYFISALFVSISLICLINQNQEMRRKMGSLEEEISQNQSTLIRYLNDLEDLLARSPLIPSKPNPKN